MNKTKLLTWAVVLLVVLNLTTVGTLLYHKYNETTDNTPVVLSSGGGGSMLNGRFFRQTLGFNAEQMDVFREANRKFRPRANKIVFQIDSLKGEMFSELKKTKPDMVKLNELEAETGTLHAELKKETNQFYLKIKTVCTPRQLEQLQITFTPLYRTPACDGQGMGRGRWHGNGFRNQ
jgi:Spy/CpxP family protein refolding chaperone